jgi:SAM-dependent methyltransferase
LSDPLLSRVERYYSGKLAEHGATAQGVDWRDEASQELRFRQLLRVADEAEELDVLDYGCGYGALVEFLRRDPRPFTYLGYDISEPMIEEARRLHSGVRFVSDESQLEPRAYALASGVLNVRLEVPDEEWRSHVEGTIARLDALATRGFAFNALTSYSDPDKMRADLWYADPRELFDLCKRRYSRHVALLHDYGLWEFTLLVRKDL